LIAAIEEDDPVIVLEPKRLYNGPFDGRLDQALKPWAGHPKAEVPEGLYRVPLGEAEVVREGLDVTVLAYGTMVHVAVAGITDAQVDAELIDLRSIVPLDIATIVASVRKTGRCVILHEASRFGGFGGELSALVQERCFEFLKAPVGRVAGWDTPYPHAFEWDYFPGPGRLAKALRHAVEY
jgi:2-oxoisovalerate dehydrogenase E1 component beta subunit